MKIKDLIKSVAALVSTREIIDHGSIRCLHSELVVEEIKAVDDCAEVGTGTIGDDDLSTDLDALAEDGDRIASIDFGDLANLEDAYQGAEVSGYIDEGKEDELRRLDSLIDAAREIL